MARKKKETVNADANAVNPAEEISEMEETIKNLEAKLEKMSKKRKGNEDPFEEYASGNSGVSASESVKGNSSLSSFVVSGADESAVSDGNASSSRIIDKDENPLSNRTYEVDPEQKEEHLIQIYLLYPITSGEIMVQIDAYLNIYQIAENRKLIQKCEAEIMKTNEPQPLQISITTKEEPNREKTVTFSKVIGIVHSLPMITSITATS